MVAESRERIQRSCAESAVSPSGSADSVDIRTKRAAFHSLLQKLR